MRRYILLIFTVVLSLVLVACGGNDSNDGTNEVESDNGDEKEVIIIGVDDKFAPMGFRDEDNELTGFDIDYAEAAAEYMGVEVKFQPIDWKTKENELSSDRIDLIWNGYTITPEREEKVDFTKPYLENAQVVAVLEDSPIESLGDLEGEVIGLQALSSAMDALEANPIYEKVAEVTEYADNVLALNDLKAGRVEDVGIDRVVIDYELGERERHKA